MVGGWHIAPIKMPPVAPDLGEGKPSLQSEGNRNSILYGLIKTTSPSWRVSEGAGLASPPPSLSHLIRKGATSCPVCTGLSREEKAVAGGGFQVCRWGDLPPTLTTWCRVSLQIHLHPGGGHVAAPQQELRDPTSRAGHQPISEV